MCQDVVSSVKSDEDALIRAQETSNDSEEDKVADLFSRQMPANASDPNAVDSLIASQMAKLSVDDREKVYMDVHGISDYDVTETPELIEKSLASLNDEIELLPEKTAYQLAATSNPDYVHNPDFCIAFLRCEKFDCPKAALRIIRHFHMKLELFGEEKLAMDITQDDFDAEDIESLYSSSGRFLNAFDSGGRIINFMIGVPKVFRTISVLRRAFYNIMLAFRDQEVQRRGAVVVVWGVGDPNGTSGDNADLNWKLPKLNEGSPMRISAIHYCFTDEVWKHRMALSNRSLSKNIIVRVRVQFGTVQECLQYLRRHGIDPDCIPINTDGKVSDSLDHCRRMEQQRTKERLNYPPRRIIGMASSRDVLLGKGTPYQNHSGNKHLRQTVSDRFKEWDRAQKGAKKAIAEDIIATIRGNGGLFLKQNDGKWIVVENDVARLKVSAAFRTLRLKGGAK